MFHLMPYRELPADYEQRYNSAYIEPIWFDVADGDKVGQFYNATLDEMLYAAKAGLHGLCTNQHHQNVYGFMSNPSIMGAVLARATNGQNVAIIQLGSTLPSTTPPTRIAEEYAMLDCISGGRPGRRLSHGLPADAALSNWRRADRATRTLSRGAGAGDQGLVGAGGVCLERQALPAWHGEPVAAADPAAASTDLDTRRRHLGHRRICGRSRSLLLPSQLLRPEVGRGGQRPLLGNLRAVRAATTIRSAIAFLQLIGVAETDAERSGFTAPMANTSSTSCSTARLTTSRIPGCLEYEGMLSALRGTIRSSINLRELKAKDFFDRGFIVVGSAKTVRDKLLDGVKRLRIGHLLTLLHFGSMPTDQTKRNIDLFAREVLPHLAPLWDDKYEDRWWPGVCAPNARLPSRRRWLRRPESAIWLRLIWPALTYAGSSFGRTGSKPRSKSAARAHHWCGCTGRGGSIPIVRLSSA
jgi:alkanesulfonate monooxygenase SsuD/methylene tetrahydromethanopterin reductase-like flavin-dependent oxidoreductase (luciferase family)